MRETHRPRHIGRSIHRHRRGPVRNRCLPDMGPADRRQAPGLATAYRTVYCVAGSYIAARRALGPPELLTFGSRPMQHWALAGGVVVTWNRGPAFGPYWYHPHSSRSRCPVPGRQADSA
jgi:hypothetical protein